MRPTQFSDRPLLDSRPGSARTGTMNSNAASGKSVACPRCRNDCRTSFFARPTNSFISLRGLRDGRPRLQEPLNGLPVLWSPLVGRLWLRDQRKALHRYLSPGRWSRSTLREKAGQLRQQNRHRQDPSAPSESLIASVIEGASVLGRNTPNPSDHWPGQRAGLDLPLPSADSFSFRK